MAFCLPFSTALTLIFSVFGTLFGLVGFDWDAFKKVIRHPISVLCVALFIWLALSMLWSIAPRDEMIEGISKYRKLLYVPLIGMLLISTRMKPLFLMNCFLLGCLIVCAGSLATSLGLVEMILGPQVTPSSGWIIGPNDAKGWFFIGPPTNPTFGRAHIAQGAFLAFASLFVLGVLLDLIIGKNRPNLDRNVIFKYIAIFLVLVYVTLNLRGMTGFVLLLLGAFLYSSLLSFRVQPSKAVFWILAIIIFILSNIYFSENLRQRISKSVIDTTEFIKNDKLTSEGQRLTYWHFGLTRGSEKPISGWGVGSYAELYSSEENQKNPSYKSRPHPHSEYVLQYFQGGAIGLLIFTSLLILIIRDQPPRKINGFQEATPQIIGIMLMVDGFANSILWDAGEGHFASIMLATIVAQKAYKVLDNKFPESRQTR